MSDYTNERDLTEFGPFTVIRITDDERQSIADSTITELAGFPVSALPRPQDADQYFSAAELWESVLPRRVRRSLSRLKNGQLDALVIEGLPVDLPGDIPVPSPNSTLPRLGSAWLGMVTRHLGHEFGYESEKQGSQIHHVIPVTDLANSQSNGSSAKTLSLHTEIAFHDIRPDFVALYCVRSPVPPPATQLVLLDEVVQDSPTWVLDCLSQSRFSVTPPDSFVIEGMSRGLVRLTPLTKKANRKAIRWHSSLRGLDGQADAAADEFRRTASRLARNVALAPGSLLVFANDHCLHGRDSFQASYDDTDRWLLRTYVLRDITRASRYDITDQGAVILPVIPARIA
jgi:L-asparagine oxygenase